MIAIENVLVSDEIVSEQFVCNLSKCKGGCCEDGDAGAPLENNERKELGKYYEIIKPYMTEEGIAEIEQHGKYIFDKEFGWVTPTINGAICAYGFRDENGIVKCAIEQACNKGKSDWKKPISCHLFPIKIRQSKSDEDLEFMNYEPREDLCRTACKLGKSLKIPVYKFLKEPIIRKYGENFYEALAATAQHVKNNQ